MSESDTICPNCGHKALTVATRCPHCGVPFDAHFYQRARTVSKVRRVPPLLLAAGVVVTLIVANAVRHQLTTGSRPTPAVTPAAPTEPAPRVAQPAARVDSAVSMAESLPRAAAPAPAATVAPAPAIEDPAPAARSVTEAGEAPEQRGAGLRRASTWINVRAGRGNSAPVLRILRPGEVVEVDSLLRGWYRVVSGAAPPGYVDYRLLDSLAP